MPHIKKQMVSFFLTTKCNLRCVYCYNSKERSLMDEQTLPLYIAKAGVDYFFSAYPSRHIRFYGPGEPTCEFSLMQDIISYAESRTQDQLTVEIQTNGCFNSNVREWLLNKANIIWISFDGEPDIQNINRPCSNGNPSSPIIEENVKWLNENKASRNLMIGARVTITNSNVLRQKQIIDYFLSLGIRQIWTDPMFPSVDAIPVCDDEKKKKSFHFDMDEYIEAFIDAYRYAKDRDVCYRSFLMCNFDGKCTQHCRACTPVPHFTPDGFVSACDMVTFGNNAHHMDCFVYGKWSDEKHQFIFDPEKIKKLQERSVSNMTHCLNCEVREYCGGYCLGEVTNETGNMYGQKPIVCDAIRRLYKEVGISDEPFQFLHP